MADIRRNLRRRAPQPVRIEWDEARLISEDEVIKATAPWGEFGLAGVRPGLHPLLPRQRFQVTPKRAFADPARVRTFHDILLRKIGPPSRVRK